LEDSPSGRAGWTRRVTLELDSAGRPRRLRANASAPVPPAGPGPADALMSDFVTASIATDGRVERGRVGRVEGGLAVRGDGSRWEPHHYRSGDPLPAALQQAVVHLARAVRERCLR